MSRKDDPRQGRHYDSSRLPTLRTDVSMPDHEALLLALYTEVCSSWRMLTDVRFKLLGFLPAVSGVALLASQNGDGVITTAVPRVSLALFGLVVTLGLYIYDRRNSELYDDLISRGRKIEEELGMDTGHFRGRPKPKNTIVTHGSATTLIYGASAAAWLYLLGVGWAW
jgi:hypothetical protein